MTDPTKQPSPLSPLELAEVLTNLPDGSTLHFKKVAGGFAVTTAVAAQELKKTKAELIEARYAGLKGVGITLSDAAEKYDVPRGTITQWVYSSRTVGFVNEASYPKLIDEAEMALCAEIYHARKKAGGQTGFPFFDEQGFLVESVKHPHRSRRLKQAA